MIETYVKWCCKLTHVPYNPKNTLYTGFNTYNYTTFKYKRVNRVLSQKQMTLDDYYFDIAI